MNEEIIFQILAVVSEIPQGKVATYGQIARLIGKEKNARLVGKVMSIANQYGDYPCHRVVNSSGRLVPGWDMQAELLRNEGISLDRNQHVNLKIYQWKI